MLKFREAKIDDIHLYLEWANDEIVRKFSFNSNIIDFRSHEIWFKTKLNDPNCFLLIFSNEYDNPVGQVRITKINNSNSVIHISVCKQHRGLNYSSNMLNMSVNYFFQKNTNIQIKAYIKKENLSSKYVFEKAGFKYSKDLIHEKHNSFLFVKANFI